MKNKKNGRKKSQTEVRRPKKQSSDSQKSDPAKKGLCCHICGHSAKKRNHLNVHLLIHDENNRLKCTKCNFKTFQKNRLKIHTKVVHEGIPYSCGECSFTSFKEVEMKFHKKSIHKGEIYQCEFCPYKTVYPEVIKRHRQSRHPLTGDLIACPEPFCDYLAKTDMTMRYHKKAVHLQVTKPSCELCGKTSANTMTLKHHMTYVHGDQNRFMCDKCDFSSNRRKKFLIHNAVQHEGFIFSCEEPGCSYKVGQPASLREHVNQVHLKKMLHCRYEGCGFQTLRRPAMYRHKSSVHAGITHDCSQCSYKAKRKDNLMAHLKIHNKELKVKADFKQDQIKVEAIINSELEQTAYITYK